MKNVKKILLVFALALVLPLATGYAQESKIEAVQRSITLVSSQAGVNTFSLPTEDLFSPKNAAKSNGNNAEQHIIARYYRAKLLQQKGILEVSKDTEKNLTAKTTLDQSEFVKTLSATGKLLKREMADAKAKGQNKSQIVKQWALSLEKSK